MSDIYNIAKSGLKTYKEGLATTGQNIANVGNEAYARREIQISEVKSGSADVLQMSDNISFGVKIDGIVRAFDQYIEMQLHDAKSGFNYSKSKTEILDRLENIVRPAEGSVSQRLNEFFQSLNDVALDPSDVISRTSALDTAKSVASSMRNVAVGVNDLRDLISASIEESVADTNLIIRQLSEIQKEVLGNSSPNSARNDLLDQRDALVSKLSEFVDIKVQYKAGGEIEILSGTFGQGQPLLSQFEVKEFDVKIVDGKNKVFLGNVDGQGAIQVQLPSGKISGLLASDTMLSEVKENLDALAMKFAEEMNELNQIGVDLNGDIGTRIFSLDSVSIQKSSTRNSDVQLQISGFSDDLVGEAHTVSYSADTGSWILANRDGETVANFSENTEVNGVTFSIIGTPIMADRFQVEFSNNKSENLSVTINDGRLFAASSLLIAEPSKENQSSAKLTVDATEISIVDDVTNLSELLTSTGNSANNLLLRDSGAIGVLKDVDGISNLASLKSQTQFQMNSPYSSLTTSSQLKVTVGGTEHSFTFGAKINDFSSYGELASLLNSGLIKTDTMVGGEYKSFKDLGLYAGGNTNKLVVSAAAFTGAAAYDLASLKIDVGNEVSAIKIDGDSTSAELQIFTREGVQLTGTPLTDNQISNLITEANGFNSGAQYNAQHLAVTSNSSYIGGSISRITTAGNYVASISSLGSSVSTNSNMTVDNVENMPSARTGMTSTLTINSPRGNSIRYEPSQGMMAGHIATALNSELSNEGLRVRASNFVELYEVPTEQIQFDLKGDNSVPVSIDYDTSVGSISAFVAAINAHTGETGIIAYSSANNRNIVLQKLDGNDISIENVAIANEGEIKLRQLDSFGEVINSPENTTPQTISTGKFASIGGQITFVSSKDFSLSYNGVENSSQTSKFEAGFVTKDYLPDNSLNQYTFKQTGLIDGGSISAEGIIPVAPSSSYTFNISSDASGELSATYKGVGNENLTSAAISANFANTFRTNAPKSHFYGNIFSLSDGFPENGSKLIFSLGDQSYEAVLKDLPEYVISGSEVNIGGTTYTLHEGLKQLVAAADFDITGPEVGRISVGFSEDTGGFKLKAVARDGVISGHALRLSDDNSAAELNAFHIDDGISGNTVANIFSNEFDTSQGSISDIATLVYGDTELAIDFVAGTPPSLNYTATSGITITVEATGTNLGVLKVSIDQSISDQNIRLKSTSASSNFGINTASTQLTINETGFLLSNHGDTRAETSVLVDSLASEIVSVDGLGGEDLIVLSTGAVNPSLIGALNVNEATTNEREITATVTSSDGKTLSLFDRNSGDYLGVRQVSATNDFLFRDYEWTFDGRAAQGDSFDLVVNTDSQDDASNILKMIDLASLSSKSGKGGYGEMYREIVVQVGYNSSAAQRSYEADEAVHEVALNRKSEFSGVDLDTEAARLLEQQQAYQALAKVLSTAKELVDTLLRSF
jgi:flagellar hook-associated protein 1 FlgK